MLLGSAHVAESVQIAQFLNENKLPCRLLNASNDQEEAEIIGQSGHPGQITVSTNMAERGVDIVLGGQQGETQREVLAAGGLKVIGIGFGQERRIRQQLRGRAGRQGDSGESCFFS